MDKNVGGADRGVRTMLGPLLVVLSLASFRKRDKGGNRRPALALAGLAVGAILTITGLTQTCPGNSLLGRNTYQSSALSEEARTVRERAIQKQE